MKQNVRIIIYGVLLCILSYGLMLILDYFVFVKLGDLTLPLTHKYLVINLNSIDRNLIRSFPLLLAIIQISVRRSQTKIYFKTVLWTFVSIISMMFLGLIIALLTWKHENIENPLLPDFLKDQPFDYYWTIFIITGLLISIIISYLLKMKKENCVQTISL